MRPLQWNYYADGFALGMISAGRVLADGLSF